MSTTYIQQKEMVLSLLNRLLNYEGVKGNKTYTEQLNAAKEKLLNEKILVVVAGEFKQGKSSLINAFLNERESSLFPVDVKVTTNLVTSISYGEEEKINVVLGQSGNNKTKPISRDEIALYVTEQQNKGNKMDARMMIVESPNPVLSDGLTIVDTPGVGSMNPEHTAITYAFIPNADTVVYTSDAQTPLSEDEIDFIKRIYKHCKNMIFVVTKIDLVRDYHDIVESNRAKLAQALEIKGNEVKIIPVSSRAKIDYLKSGDEDDLEDSNFAAFEGTIWEMVRERRAAITLMPVLGVIGKTIIDIKKPIAAEWSACQQENKQKTLEKQRELQEIIKQKQQFMEKNAEWLTALSDGMRRLQQSVNYDFDMGFSDVQQKANTYFDNNKIVSKPDYLLSLIESDINSLMLDTSKQMMDKAGQLHEQLTELTGLNINKAELEELGFNLDDEDKNIQVKRVDKFRKTVAAVKGGSFNATYAGGLGSVIGGILGAAAGTLIGGPVGTYYGAYYGALIGGGVSGVAGAFTGARDAIASLNDKDRAAVKGKVIPVMGDACKKCKYLIADTIGNLERSVRDDLKEQIKLQKRQYEEMLEKIQYALGLSSEEAAKRVKQLEVSIQSINAFFKQFESITIEVNTGISASSPDAQASKNDAAASEAQKAASTGNQKSNMSWADA